MDEFVTLDKLTEVSFLAYDDTQQPPIPHYFGIYQKININTKNHLT